MKKLTLIIGICMMLAGCGNATGTDMAQDAAMESVAATEAAGATGTEASAKEAAETGTSETGTESSMEEAEAAAENALSQNADANKKNAAGTDKIKTDETGTATKESTEISVEEKLKEVEKNVTVFEQPKTMYATHALNVRRGPSTEYEVLSHLTVAQAVEVTGQADTGWYQLKVDGVNMYASNVYLSETKVEAPAPTPAPTPNPATGQTPTATVAPAGVIMVGDSRCVQMQAAVGGGGCSWICENSKEYTWFSETAIPKFDQYVGNGTKVVINMGVNDPEHYRQYAELINAKAAEWASRGARTYLVSVNPVWENPYVTQEQVDTFNANVPGMLSGVTWIDTSSWLNTNGYRLLDGLHYDDPTYVNIFNLIMGSL